MVRKESSNKKIFLKYQTGKLAHKENVNLQGWVKSNRNNGSIGFIEFNDGTYFKNIQLVYEKDYEKYSHIRYGSTIDVVGTIRLTPENKQPFEIEVEEITVLNDCDEDYPLQKKRHSFEFLREIAHLRPRANTFYALYRVRNALTYAIHKFFQDRDFIYIHTPIITGNDAEGAGQVFKVVTDLKHPDEFFKSEASLTVSGQLHVEPFALTYKDVYTFGPTFRAENSNTTRHASEFWMIEPEMAFCDLEDNMNVIEAFLKYIIKYTIKNCPKEMNFFDTMIEKGLLDKLNRIVKSKFKRLTYTKAIDLLLKAKKEGVKFEYSDIKWGMDLQSEHERYITEVAIKGPVFITDYPKNIKAFYMKQNSDGNTVAACDLLVPYVGELIGGSQREENYEVLKTKMEEMGNIKGLEWYLDLRRYGGCIHSGFGLGFDRLLMYITGMNNIRDVQPYPRTPGSLKF